MKPAGVGGARSVSHLRWLAPAALAVVVAVGVSSEVHAQPLSQPFAVSPVGYRIVDGVADTADPLDASGVLTPTFTSVTSPSSGSAIDSRVIIGTDSRGFVDNTAEFPYRAVGAVDFNGRSNVCTGWLSSARVVVTAGHCVELGGRIVDDWTFSPGRNGQSIPFGSSAAQEIWTDNATGVGHDWAVVVLDRPIGVTVGWFGTTRTPPVTGASATVTGYPTDKSPGTMWSATDAIAQVDSGSFSHTVDTYGGQSGSPVASAAQVHGIHVSGAFRSNLATLLTPSLHDVIINLGSRKRLVDLDTLISTEDAVGGSRRVAVGSGGFRSYRRASRRVRCRRRRCGCSCSGCARFRSTRSGCDIVGCGPSRPRISLCRNRVDAVGRAAASRLPALGVPSLDVISIIGSLMTDW